MTMRTTTLLLAGSTLALLTFSVSAGSTDKETTITGAPHSASMKLAQAKRDTHEGHDHKDHADDKDHADHKGHDHKDHATEKEHSDHKDHDHKAHSKSEKAKDHKGQDHKDHADHEKDGHKDHADDKDHADHKGHDHKDHPEEKEHSDHKGHDHKAHSKPKKAKSHEGHDHKDHDTHDHEKKEKRSDVQDGSDHKGHEHAESEKPKKADAHDDHGHGDEGHGAHVDVVKLTADQQKDFEITTEVARSGSLATQIVRPAEIKFNQDRVAHVVPRIAGVVRTVSISEGDRVKAGTIMAVLDSRELADSKASFLAAHERMLLARETFSREEALWKKKISSVREYLNAKSKYAEKRIDRRGAAQKLLALGFSKKFLDNLIKSDDEMLTAYQLVAPFSGTVISRHISRGEAVSSGSEAFLLADIAELWVDITIYPKDLPHVREGLHADIDLGDGSTPVRGRIAFVSPHLSEATRTAYARLKLANVDGRLRPGMFVKANISVSTEAAEIRVPRTAIQRIEESSVVFINKDGEFKPRPVKVGRVNGRYAEIVSGLKKGESFVTRGAFTLKAQLSKASFDDGHNH